MKEFETPLGLETKSKSVMVGYDADQVKLQLIEVSDGQVLDHALSSGRVAFACNSAPPIYEKVKNNGDEIVNSPITLKTPGEIKIK